MTARLMPKRIVVGSAYNIKMQFITTAINARPLRPGERYLGRFIVPKFQRPLVWTESQKEKLIESIYMGLPIGALIYNETTEQNECDGWLLDGQQRTNAMVEYIRGSFKVFGYRFPDLPEIEKSHYLRMTVPVCETHLTDPQQCQDIYERLVYGGTPHDPR